VLDKFLVYYVVELRNVFRVQDWSRHYRECLLHSRSTICNVVTLNC